MKNSILRIMHLFALCAVALMLFSCGASLSPYDTVYVGGECITLCPKDELYTVSHSEVWLNEKEFDGFPVLFTGITAGSSLEDVISAYGITEGYALINAEISNGENDGTTSVIETGYTKEFFEEYEKSYTDALIIFGYKLGGGKPVLMTDGELSAALETCTGGIIYGIDINGLDGNTVGVGEVFGIEIKYFPR